MKESVIAIFGKVYETDKNASADKTVGFIECELVSGRFPTKRGLVKVEMPDKPAEPRVVVEDSWWPLIGYVDFSHTALSHYFTAALPGSTAHQTKVAMDVEFP